eukprot:SAG31_NODE_3130_length_4643_cov_264.060079_3_plen_108_part_00
MTYLAHVAVSPKRFHFNRDFFVFVQKGTKRGSSYLYSVPRYRLSGFMALLNLVARHAYGNPGLESFSCASGCAAKTLATNLEKGVPEFAARVGRSHFVHPILRPVEC